MPDNIVIRGIPDLPSFGPPVHLVGTSTSRYAIPLSYILVLSSATTISAPLLLLKVIHGLFCSIHTSEENNSLTIHSSCPISIPLRKQHQRISCCMGEANGNESHASQRERHIGNKLSSRVSQLLDDAISSGHCMEGADHEPLTSRRLT